MMSPVHSVITRSRFLLMPSFESLMNNRTENDARAAKSKTISTVRSVEASSYDQFVGQLGLAEEASSSSCTPDYLALAAAPIAF